MERRNEIENFNKKALYILIREMTDVETSHITKVANVGLTLGLSVVLSCPVCTIVLAGTFDSIPPPTR